MRKTASKSHGIAPEGHAVKAEDIVQALYSMHDEGQSQILSRFFKTGKGEYGYGDKFIGLRVPQTRMVVKEARLRVSFEEIEKLLNSEWHEARLCAQLLLVEEMLVALPKGTDTRAKAARREEITRFYLSHARQANNWDLVDSSCPYILGNFLLYTLPDGTMPDRGILDRLAESTNLWEQRIAIVTNWLLIRHDQLSDTLRIADKLLGHEHDLIHKAVGWMLREVGKRDMGVLEDYLETRHGSMHRTTLRYAIERMDEARRRYWMQRD